MAVLIDWLLSGQAIGWALALVLLVVVLLMLIRQRKIMLRNGERHNRSITSASEHFTNESPKQSANGALQHLSHGGTEQSFAANRVPLQSANTTHMNHDTFLSYSREDEQYVRNIYEYLCEEDIKVWFDLESIKPGEDWLDAMQEGISNSRTCLVFYRGEAGVWQKEETKEAIRKKAKNTGFKVIPVLLPGGTESDPSLPSMLSGTTWVDLRDGLFNIPALKKLVGAIRGGDLVPIHQVPQEPLSDSDLPTGYSADVKKIISLLIGDALYSRHDVSIRELIQNAVDACERRGNTRFGATASARITVNIDLKEGYFEVIDNGDGMNPKHLAEYFAVIGRSIREEENVINRLEDNEKTRAHLIGKFGIGFISTYILAKRIFISTTYEGSTQINLEINGISDPFTYHESSKVGRNPDEIGTTVRVYLKDTFRPGGKTDLNVLTAVEEFCRHVQYITVTKDGSTVQINENWNNEESIVVELIKVPFKFELHLGISQTSLDFFASNAGFLINKTSLAISPKFMPKNIGGEINFFPGVVDLNMARDTIIENDKAIQVRALVSKGIKRLLVKAAAEESEETRGLLRKILIGYLELALRYEQQAKLNKNENDLEAPPLSSIEAAELLMDVWLVDLSGQKLRLRDALRVVKRTEKYRVYTSSHYKENEQILKLIEESLKNRGFLVLPPETDLSEINIIEFKSAKSEFFMRRSALEYLAKRYYFDLYPVEKSSPEDIEHLTISRESVTPTVEKILGSIESSTGKKILLSGLEGAPAVFELAGQTYLNVSSDLFGKVVTSFENYEDSILRAYLLGLLQCEIC